MKFRNQRHREMFTKAIRQLDRGNYTLMAVVYLFTADTRLWSMTEKSICYSGVDFRHIGFVGRTHYHALHGRITETVEKETDFATHFKRMTAEKKNLQKYRKLWNCPDSCGRIKKIVFEEEVVCVETRKPSPLPL